MTMILPIDLPLPSGLRRPRLLMRAARIGLADYRRDRDLRRILPPSAGRDVLDWLRDEEARFESLRLAAAAGYSALRHIEVMIALLAELRLTRPDGITA